MKLRIEIEHDEVVSYASKHGVSPLQAYEIAKEQACATMRKAYGHRAAWWKESSYLAGNWLFGTRTIYALDFYPSANEALLDAPENQP